MKILRTVINVILVPFTNLIINLCIETSTFPDSLKLAKVLRIHKKGSKTDPANYPPISILPFLSKVFEKLIGKQISNYIEINNLFHSSQFGFRKHCSTALSIGRLCQEISYAFEAGQHLNAQFFDLKKAFDCMSHSILLNYLTRYGFQESSVLLLESYLNNRSQFVSVGSKHSDVRKLSIGVPQGSVLGPVLFLIYLY